ncbi:GTP-binding protein [Fonticula alba]|uniref:GTP-binding protein n=1 Tax=Fonticula alba TaxID=691883 RepID=A0A058Z2P4_FONAL|nr:GTP-binding protein [Fonticula alba]KCV68208.1 GTP-binding protein [Fonticula alba]|eukprot:XP_009497262.1 GTP-binding protein [Fonticula alba]
MLRQAGFRCTASLNGMLAARSAGAGPARQMSHLARRSAVACTGSQTASLLALARAGPVPRPGSAPQLPAHQPLRFFSLSTATGMSAQPAGATGSGSLTPEQIVKNTRNVAIIAHVDHGKTTLVDTLLKSCNEELSGVDRVMDSDPQERERGITIMASATSVSYGDYNLNIVDTPGHADFGGEVERVLGMVDAVVLVVDATEGPMTQTKAVLAKALQNRKRAVVILNKVDRESARLGAVENEVFDLFCSLGADDDQLSFPILYTSGRDGWAVDNPDDIPLIKSGKKTADMRLLLDAIIEVTPSPEPEALASPFSMAVTMIHREPFLGRVATGRIATGSVKVGDPLHVLLPKTANDSTPTDSGRVTKLLKRRGVDRLEIEEAHAGDIVMICGLSKPLVTNTVASPSVTVPLDVIPIDPPTVSMMFSPNDSPFNGREGKSITSAQLLERLQHEMEHNVSIRVGPHPTRSDSFEVQGRGEMQLGVLIENMRREGMEFSVSPPTVVYHNDENGRQEPMEEVVIEVDEQYTGIVIEKLSIRKGEMLDMSQELGNKTKLTFRVPSRGLIGYRPIFMVDTHGTGIMNRAFTEYVPYRGQFERVRKGVIVSMDTGVSTAFALNSIEARGQLFIGANVDVYPGMVIGEHSRDNDLDVNPIRAKKVTNIRTTAADEQIRLTPPRQMSLEEALGYINPDELVEVTPKNVRIRKQILDAGKRRTNAKVMV